MRIGLLDHMGYGNLGDAATQEALIANIRARLPEANIVGFSLNPNDTMKRHNILCHSITHWHPGLRESRQTTAADEDCRSKLKSILKNIPVFSALALSARNLVRELAHLVRSIKVLRSLDCLIIAGGGQLCELWRGPWSHPYNVYKFSVLTKLANKKLLFLNVGAGPLKSVLSREFTRWAVDMADYASFRDVESQSLARQLGVKRHTHVFPDSAYALDISGYETDHEVRPSRPLVGINPIGYCDPRIWPDKNVSAYSHYLDNLASFAEWLLNHNYRLRVFSPEASVDMYALDDLRGRLLTKLSPGDVSEIWALPSETVKGLLCDMSRCDFIITSKFHGVVFSHLLAKPVIALSYHRKIDDLMRTVGHSRYCLNIGSFDEECLKETFLALLEDVQELKSKFRQATASYSGVLKAQFDGLFTANNLQSYSDELRASPSSAVVRPSECRIAGLSGHRK
jgi:polysaccharide pyruvyl transferase WcaK-like protein